MDRYNLDDYADGKMESVRPLAVQSLELKRAAVTTPSSLAQRPVKKAASSTKSYPSSPANLAASGQKTPPDSRSEIFSADGTPFRGMSPRAENLGGSLVRSEGPVGGAPAPIQGGLPAAEGELVLLPDNLQNQFETEDQHQFETEEVYETRRQHVEMFLQMVNERLQDIVRGNDPESLNLGGVHRQLLDTAFKGIAGRRMAVAMKAFVDAHVCLRPLDASTGVPIKVQTEKYGKTAQEKQLLLKSMWLYHCCVPNVEL